jgi:hypothetical protein
MFDVDLRDGPVPEQKWSLQRGSELVARVVDDGGTPLLDWSVDLLGSSGLHPLLASQSSLPHSALNLSTLARSRSVAPGARPLQRFVGRLFARPHLDRFFQ